MQPSPELRRDWEFYPGRKKEKIQVMLNPDQLNIALIRIQDKYVGPIAISVTLISHIVYLVGAKFNIFCSRCTRGPLRGQTRRTSSEEKAKSLHQKKGREFNPCLNQRGLNQFMRSVFLFQVEHYQESRGAHGGHGEQARSSMQKAARAQRSRILGLK